MALKHTEVWVFPLFKNAVSKAQNEVGSEQVRAVGEYALACYFIKLFVYSD